MMMMMMIIIIRILIIIVVVTIGVLGFDSRRGLGIFLFTTESRMALRPP
jgi:hypothetical protein